MIQGICNIRHDLFFQIREALVHLPHVGGSLGCLLPFPCFPVDLRQYTSTRARSPIRLGSRIARHLMRKRGRQRMVAAWGDARLTVAAVYAVKLVLSVIDLATNEHGYLLRRTSRNVCYLIHRKELASAASWRTTLPRLALNNTAARVRLWGFNPQGFIEAQCSRSLASLRSGLKNFGDVADAHGTGLRWPRPASAAAAARSRAPIACRASSGCGRTRQVSAR